MYTKWEQHWLPIYEKQLHMFHIILSLAAYSKLETSLSVQVTKLTIQACHYLHLSLIPSVAALFDALSLSLSLSHTHTHTFSLSLPHSLSHFLPENTAN